MIDWGNPSKSVLAAMRMARRCAEKGGMNETLFVEWVLGAKESLWYLQAAAWAEESPKDIPMDERARTSFQAGMALVVRIVDLGYDEEHDWWWYLPTIWPGRADQDMGVLLLMDTAMMLERMQNIAIWPKDVPREYAQPGFLTVSAGFWVFFSLICGPRWRQRFQALMRGMQEARRLKIDGGRQGR